MDPYYLPLNDKKFFLKESTFFFEKGKNNYRYNAWYRYWRLVKKRNISKYLKNNSN